MWTDVRSDRFKFSPFSLAFGTDLFFFRRNRKCILNLLKGQLTYVDIKFRRKRFIPNKIKQ